ncbi:hypothetical protein LUZ62_082347 [Rhynchospora pubera]|uniref:Aminotransferase-like plant mobile domain-containing protein n=1 Tax=Rhynchospora pubera TaxID=906938 RepID=A0AAV8BZZ8_9POAL|nr:hypothetical protein LUZ62_082347 [Rhynchospora pubera]
MDTGVQGQEQGRGRGRGRAQDGPSTSTGRDGQGRGRGRGRGRARGRGRGLAMQGQIEATGSSHTNESEELPVQFSDPREPNSINSDETPGHEAPSQDANEAEPSNIAQKIWCPPYFTEQKSHRSKAVIYNSNPRELVVRHHKVTLDWDEEYKPYLLNSGLYGVHQIGYILADCNLITALVERWRPESHTFHFPVGEMAVTLEDVAMLFGLRIDGEAICEQQGTHYDWPDFINTYLGRSVDEETFRSGSKTAIRISWLQKHFKTRNEDDPVHYFARAYMLMLVGSVLFTDLSGDSISVTYLPFIVNLEGKTYSWGSAVLAYLHKEFCRGCQRSTKQIGGPVLLLQLWSWTRFLFGRPEARDGIQKHLPGGNVPNERPPYGYIWSGFHKWTNNPVRSLKYYRDEIDLMREYQVNWVPYGESHHLLPPICLELPHLWLSKVPLINLRIVEPYNPHRVMRQFGKHQEFPPCHYTTAVSFTCSSKSDAINRTNGVLYVAQWNRRLDFQITEARPYDATPTFYDKYMEWYAQNTILQLQKPKAMGPPSIDPCRLLFQAKAANNLQACKELKEIAEDTLKRRKETAEAGTKAFTLEVLLRLKNVLKILGHNVEIDETFKELQEQLQAEEGEQEAQVPGVVATNENEASPSNIQMSIDGDGTSDESEFFGSKRLRGG